MVGLLGMGGCEVLGLGDDVDVRVVAEVEQEWGGNTLSFTIENRSSDTISTTPEMV